MWGDLAKDLVGILLEAGFDDCIETKKRKRLNRQLVPVVTDLVDSYADTSLDSSDFYRLVKSDRFLELIRNLYFSLDDRSGSLEYITRVEEYILQECPSVRSTEVREFLRSLQTFYERHLHKVIASNPEINAQHQLLIKSHREIIAKISKTEETFRLYIESLINAQSQIANADINEYHKICEKRYSEVRFTGISGVESKRTQNINDFYVENSFSYYEKDSKTLSHNEDDTLGPICLRDFFKNGNKVILIGAAGLGKSTTLNYLFCNYENLYGAHSVKIKIDLKEYAEEVGVQKKDILWCVTSEFYKKIKRKNISFDSAENLLAGFLESGRCLVIFDALDEIPTQPVREKVRDEIATFCDLYYLNRFIISTREVGYLRNQFDESFLHIRINEFNDEQVKKYTENWFTICRKDASYAISDESQTETDDENTAFDDFWERFQIEALRARCTKLIRNPIVLILALVVFDIENNLPNRRVEFYKKCIETFLAVRENRKAAVKLSEKAKNILGIDLVVPQIAYYKFSAVSQNLRYKFTYEQLQESIFHAIEVQDRINWISAVNEYTTYLVERTELIREVDEDVLDFAHKTFYEYFLAVYFTKVCEIDELLLRLEEWIGDANYDELARLIIEVIIQNDDPKQHKLVINYLFEQIDNEDHAYAFFSILEDLYAHNLLHPKFHTDYHSCILYHSNLANIQTQPYVDRERSSPAYDRYLLAKMYCDAAQNQDTFAKTIDALYFLDDDFRRHVVNMTSNTDILQIVGLMDTVNKFQESKKLSKTKRIPKAVATINYFCTEGLVYTLNYPQIFVSIVNLMAATNHFDYERNLLDLNFDTTCPFFFYMTPSAFCKLMQRSTDTPERFLLLLVCIIRCARGNTNYLFNYLAQRHPVFRKHSNTNVPPNEALHNTLTWAWSALYQSRDFMEFKSILSQRGLYSEEFGALSEKLYREYVTHEKTISSDYAETYLQDREEIGYLQEAILSTF